MSSSLRLPTDQTDQRRRRNGDNGYRDQTGSQNVSETIHHEKINIFSIHPLPMLGRIAITFNCDWTHSWRLDHQPTLQPEDYRLVATPAAASPLILSIAAGLAGSVTNSPVPASHGMRTPSESPHNSVAELRQLYNFYLAH